MRLSTSSNTARFRCTLNVSLSSLNSVVSSQLFESIGTLKYNIVQFANKHAFKFFNNNIKPITKTYFFGDSNNPQLILQYDFAKDNWSKKFVPENLNL